MGQVVVSEDPQAFLSQLSTMSAFNDYQDQLFSDYAREAKALDIRARATQKRADEVAKIKDQLGREKATIDKKLAEAQSLLDRLEAEERERMLASRSSTMRVPTNVPASGRAGAAVSYAMAQVGDSLLLRRSGPQLPSTAPA